MSTGGKVALALGGAAAVGGVVYLMTRSPVTVGTAAGLRPVPPQQAAGVGTAAIAIGTGLGGLFTSIFGSSKSNPTTATILGQTQYPQAAAQSWNNTGESTFDELAAGDAAQGIEGPF